MILFLTFPDKFRILFSLWFYFLCPNHKFIKPTFWLTKNSLGYLRRVELSVGTQAAAPSISVYVVPSLGLVVFFFLSGLRAVHAASWEALLELPPAATVSSSDLHWHLWPIFICVLGVMLHSKASASPPGVLLASLCSTTVTDFWYFN